MNPSARARLLETLSIMVMLVCVVALGVPKYRDVQRQDQARRILADVEIVRDAVYRFYSDSAAFPAEGLDGEFSEGLAAYLPPTFVRLRPYGTIEYRNWALHQPRPRSDAPTFVAAPVPEPVVIAPDSARPDSTAVGPATVDAPAPDTIEIDSIAMDSARMLAPPPPPSRRRTAVRQPDAASQPAQAVAAPTSPNVIAISVIPRDPRIAAAASAIAYAMPQFTMGNRFFFILFGS